MVEKGNLSKGSVICASAWHIPIGSATITTCTGDETRVQSYSNDNSAGENIPCSYIDILVEIRYLSHTNLSERVPPKYLGN